MNFRTALGLLAALGATALPAASYGQRHNASRPTSRYLGSGPFYPSNLNGNGYRQQFRNARQPLSIGGVKVYFPRRGGYGGGYGGATPIFGLPYTTYPTYPYGYTPYPVPFRYGYFYPY